LDLSFYVDQALELMLMGLFQDETFRLGNVQYQTEFRVVNLELLPSPDFTTTMVYTTGSPVVISEKLLSGFEDYLHPNDERFAVFCAQHICSKYQVVTGQRLEATQVEVAVLDHSRTKQRLVHFKAGTEDVTHVKAFTNFSIQLTAPVAVQQVVYASGLGKYTSSGMGYLRMVSVENQQEDLGGLQTSEV
jgi:CRISPR-associated endoribonuclease Cas6